MKRSKKEVITYILQKTIILNWSRVHFEWFGLTHWRRGNKAAVDRMHWEKHPIKRHKKDTIIYVLPDVTISGFVFSCKVLGVIHLEKDFITEEQTRGNHLPRTSIIGWFLYFHPNRLVLLHWKNKLTLHYLKPGTHKLNYF